MGEDWAPVPDSRGYEVSICGDVRRLGRLLKPCLYSTGYLMADIYFEDGGHRRRGVHTLVLEAFIGPRPVGHECLHRNGNRSDNRLENLRYGTRRENMADQYLHGTRVMGDNHPRAKLSYAAADDIRARNAHGETAAGLAREFGVSKKAVLNLLHNKTWVRLTAAPAPALTGSG